MDFANHSTPLVLRKEALDFDDQSFRDRQEVFECPVTGGVHAEHEALILTPATLSLRQINFVSTRARR